MQVTDVSAELGKRIRELVEFANEHHIAAPDLLWHVAACVMVNMHAEIRRAMLTRVELPLVG